jgi:hypothetical protein
VVSLLHTILVRAYVNTLSVRRYSAAKFKWETLVLIFREITQSGGGGGAVGSMPVTGAYPGHFSPVDEVAIYFM